MSVVWSLQSDAVVRPPAVIEDDEALYLFQSLLIRLKTPVLTVYALALDRAVHTLCYGIVSGFVVLRHRDLYAVFLQFLHIEVTTVLDAAIRVVDESGEATSTSLFYGHAEGFEREDSSQRFCQAPANYFLRVGIRYEMQIAASASDVNIGYIALPQLVGSCWFESLDEILPLVVAVVGVRRRTAPARLLHESVTTQQVQERITPRHPACVEHHAEHRP